MADLLLQFHVVISLIGIASGLVVLYGMTTANPARGWTAVFLAATILTAITGFPLAPYGMDPARIIGIILLALMAAAVVALYAFRLAGAWRWIYVVTAVASLYLNCFVAVIQAFQKIPFLKALAPTQSEPPFVIAQVALIAAFAVLGVIAVIRFHPGVAAISSQSLASNAPKT